MPRPLQAGLQWKKTLTASCGFLRVVFDFAQQLEPYSQLLCLSLTKQSMLHLIVLAQGASLVTQEGEEDPLFFAALSFVCVTLRVSF